MIRLATGFQPEASFRPAFVGVVVDLSPVRAFLNGVAFKGYRSWLGTFVTSFAGTVLLTRDAARPAGARSAYAAHFAVGRVTGSTRVATASMQAGSSVFLCPGQSRPWRCSSVEPWWQSRASSCGSVKSRHVRSYRKGYQLCVQRHVECISRLFIAISRLLAGVRKAPCRMRARFAE